MEGAKYVSQYDVCMYSRTPKDIQSTTLVAARGLGWVRLRAGRPAAAEDATADTPSGRGV